MISRGRPLMKAVRTASKTATASREPQVTENRPVKIDARSGSHRRGQQAEPIDEVSDAAEIIWDRSPPSRIEDWLAPVIEQIGRYRLEEEAAFRPGKLKQWLEGYQKRTTALVQWTKDREEYLRYLCAASGWDFTEVSRALDVLEETIVPLSAAAAAFRDFGRPSAVQIAIEQIHNTSGGGGPARLKTIAETMPAQSRAKLHCACVVVELWKLARGEPPGDKAKAAAAEAAAHFWQASGGKELRGGRDRGEAGGGWRYWIDLILQAENHSREAEKAAVVRRALRHVLKPE